MNRANHLKKVKNKKNPWDIIIIGGGASGLGAAVDAASRGYRTLLLEKKDFRKHLVNALNEDVDIPIINEKTEGKVMEAIYKQIIKALKTIDLDEMI